MLLGSTSISAFCGCSMINESAMTIFGNQVAMPPPTVRNLVHLSFWLEIGSVEHHDSEIHKQALMSYLVQEQLTGKESQSIY
jgi:hypothetical protein